MLVSMASPPLPLVGRLDATTDRLSRAEKELKQVRQAHVDQQHRDLLEQASHSSDQQTYRMMELEGRLGHISCYSKRAIAVDMVQHNWVCYNCLLDAC